MSSPYRRPRTVRSFEGFLGKRVAGIKYSHGQEKDDAFVEYAKRRAYRDSCKDQKHISRDPEQIEEILELFGSMEEFEMSCAQHDQDLAWLDIYDDRCRAFGGAGWY